MEGTGLSATAMLTPTDAGGRQDAATVTMAREEIEEALASDEPLELVLTVDRGAGSPQDVRVNWQRSDLETVLAGTDAGGITFSFDRAELYRALEHPDFEGHGIREMVLLTVAAASASAALAASSASGQIMEATGGGGGTSVTAVQPGDPGTIPYLSQGIGVDQSQFQGEASTAGTPAEPGTIPYLSQGIGVDQSQFQGEASTAGTPAEPGTIPYLSQGIGVDQSQFQGEASTAGTPGRARNDPVPEPGDRRRPEPVPGRSVDRRHRRDASGTRRGIDRRRPRRGRRTGRRRLRLEPRAAVRRPGHGRRDRRPCRREPAHRRRRLRGPPAHDARLAPSSAEGRCVAAALRVHDAPSGSMVGLLGPRALTWDHGLEHTPRGQAANDSERGRLALAWIARRKEVR